MNPWTFMPPVQVDGLPEGALVRPAPGLIGGVSEDRRARVEATWFIDGQTVLFLRDEQTSESFHQPADRWVHDTNPIP